MTSSRTGPTADEPVQPGKSDDLLLRDIEYRHHRVHRATSEEHTPYAGPQTAQTLLATADALIRDTLIRVRFGELDSICTAVFGSRLEPFAAAMQRAEPTAQVHAAAHAVARFAHRIQLFARDMATTLADIKTARTGGGSYEHYAELAMWVDDSFRAFSSSPEFDRARRHAITTILDWLERDPAAASRITCAFEASPVHPQRHRDTATSADAVAIMRDGNTALIRYPAGPAVRVSMLIVPGFTTGAHLFDLDPQCSVAGTFARHGIETYLLDWGRCDDTDRSRTITDQLERIDRAVDTIRTRTNGRCLALAGHFHGGLLALLYCIRYPDKIGALVTFSTPVEFASKHDVLGGWLRACDGERLVAIFGNIPGALIAALLATASPMPWFGDEDFALFDGARSATAAARARRPPPAFPGETFRQLHRSFYRDNTFLTKGVALGDCRYDLTDLALPLINVFAHHDRIVPPDASAPLGARIAAANYVHRRHRSGHFDLLVGDSAHTQLLPDIAAWLIRHTR